MSLLKRIAQAVASEIRKAQSKRSIVYCAKAVLGQDDSEAVAGRMVTDRLVVPLEELAKTIDPFNEQRTLPGFLSVIPDPDWVSIIWLLRRGVGTEWQPKNDWARTFCIGFSMVDQTVADLSARINLGI